MNSDEPGKPHDRDETVEVRRPKRPPERFPHLRSAWDRLFDHEPFFRPDVRIRRLRRQTIPVAQFVHIPAAPTRILSSRNWSGASVVPHDGKQVVLQFGEWNVPEPKPPPLADQQIETGKYGCSTWIGLDGNRRYINASLPQIGTVQSLPATGGPAEYSAFFQWWSFWEKAPAKFLFRLADLNIDTGATITAMLWAADSYTVVAAMLVSSLGKLQFFEQEFTAPPIELPGPVVTHPSVSGATAEWIVERPLDFHAQPMAFPDYGEVKFHRCVVGSAAGPGEPTGEQVLDGPRILRMFETPPNPPCRVRMISHAHRTGSTDLSVRYGHS